jgi:hypothetical protein
MRRTIFKTRSLAIIASLLLFSGLIAQAQQLKISARFDSSAIQIGDQIKLRFEVIQPANAKVKVKFPSFADTITGKIEIVQIFPADSSVKEGMLHIHKDYLITSFDSGFYQVPSLAFPYEAGQAKDTLKSDPCYLRVNPVPVGSAKDIRDIKPPLRVPFSIWEYWIYILGVLGVIIILFILWYFIKFRKKKGFLFMPAKAIEPPHIIALKELDALRAEKLWQNNKTKNYYTNLTDIIRTYIEKRFGVNALEQTSDEIIQSLASVYLEDQSVVNLLKSIFATADLVKFAKGQPLPDENEINLLNAYQFVNNTTPNVPSAIISNETDESNENKELNKN